MKIKIRNSDGCLLDACIHNMGDAFISMPFDASTETVITIPNNPSYLEGWKYKYIGGEIVKSSEYTLSVTSNASDSDGDGVVDIAANGTSYATLTIQKKNLDGSNATGDDAVWVSCSSGKLDTIYSHLNNGSLEIELTSTTETVLSTVQVTAKNKLITDGSIQIQFRPR